MILSIHKYNLLELRFGGVYFYYYNSIEKFLHFMSDIHKPLLILAVLIAPFFGNKIF